MQIVIKMQTPDFYKIGYDLALQNAKTLFVIANKAFLENAYGIACSLNILSSEEILKATFLIIQYYHPTGKINEFENIFHKHKSKHKQLKEYVAFQSKVQNDIKKFLVQLSPIINMLNEIAPSLPKNEQEKIKDLVNKIRLFKKHSELSLDFDGILNWLENANNDKNKGFYVDKTKEAWLSPKDISKEKFEVEKKYTEAFIQYAENIEQLFSIQAEIKNFN